MMDYMFGIGVWNWTVTEKYVALHHNGISVVPKEIRCAIWSTNSVFFFNMYLPLPGPVTATSTAPEEWVTSLYTWACNVESVLICGHSWKQLEVMWNKMQAGN